MTPTTPGPVVAVPFAHKLRLASRALSGFSAFLMVAVAASFFATNGQPALGPNYPGAEDPSLAYAMVTMQIAVLVAMGALVLAVSSERLLRKAK